MPGRMLHVSPVGQAAVVLVVALFEPDALFAPAPTFVFVFPVWGEPLEMDCGVTGEAPVGGFRALLIAGF